MFFQNSKKMAKSSQVRYKVLVLENYEHDDECATFWKVFTRELSSVDEFAIYRNLVAEGYRKEFLVNVEENHEAL